MTEPTEVPRLTPTQRLHEVTMQALTRSPRNASESVEVSRNAKGDFQFTVTAVTQDGETLEDVARRAMLHAERLADQFSLSRAQIIAQTAAGEKKS